MKRIVFDLDGTLFDTFSLHCKNISKVGECIFGKPISPAKVLLSSRSTIPWQIQALFGDYLQHEALCQYIDFFVKDIKAGLLYDSVHICAFLRKIHNIEFSISLLTGRDYLSTIEILKYYQIIDLFDTILCYEEGHMDKSDFYYTSRVLRTDSIYVTDSISEVNCFKLLVKDIYVARWFSKYPEVRTCKQIISLNQLYNVLTNCDK